MSFCSSSCGCIIREQEKILRQNLKDQKSNHVFTFIGTLCASYKLCCECKAGLKGGEVKKSETSLMGYGLFADEDIAKGTYIIRYRGEILDEIDNNTNNDYVAVVKYEIKRQRKTCLKGCMQYIK